MKKIIAVLLTAALLLTACGSAGSATVAQIYDRIKSEVNFKNQMLEMTDDYFVMQFGFDLSTFEDYKFLKSEDVMLAENVVLIQVRDSAAATAVKSKLEEFVSEQKSIFASYAPDQSAVVENSVVGVKGNVVYLLMSSEIEALKNVVK